MVGFVIVSHSETLANGVVELTKMMADGVPIRAAGGLDGGGFGTSYENISNAIDEIYSDDGVIVSLASGSLSTPLRTVYPQFWLSHLLQDVFVKIPPVISVSPFTSTAG